MTYFARVALVYVCFILLTAVPAAQASGELLLGDGCYVIPTESSLVRVLVGAKEKEGVLVSVLTSGEVWVLKTFFSLEPQKTDVVSDIELCTTK